MSAPAPAPPDIEEDIELDLEMDVEPGCQVENCEEDADWVGVLSLCKHSLLLCSDCRIDFENRIARQREAGNTVFAFHNGCAAKNRDWTWRRL